MAKSFKTVAGMVAKLNKLADQMHELVLKDADGWTVGVASDYLNCGGCAWFAKEIAKICDLNFVGLTVLDYSHPEEFEQVKAKATNNPRAKKVDWWNCNGIHFNHVVATFVIDGEIYYYDGAIGLRSKHSRTWKHSHYGRDVGILDITHVEPLVKTVAGWNRSFRQEYKKPIKALITKILNPTKSRTKKVEG